MSLQRERCMTCFTLRMEETGVINKLVNSVLSVWPGHSCLSLLCLSQSICSSHRLLLEVLFTLCVIPLLIYLENLSLWRMSFVFYMRSDVQHFVVHMRLVNYY